MELSKSDKKAARVIIEKGLQVELANGLAEFESILAQWRADNAADNRQAYHTLYKSVRDFDKHIAWRYDDIRSSDYLFIIVNLLTEGLINRADLLSLSDNAQSAINTILSIQNELK